MAKKGIKAPKGASVIGIDWLNTNVIVLHNTEQRQKLAKRLKLQEDDDFLVSDKTIGGMASCLYDNGVPYFIIYLPDPTMGIIIHECVHMVHIIMENHGIPVCGDNTETMAYMTAHLCGQVIHAIEGATVN